MTEKTCMNCGTVGCDHKDARRCASGNSLWTPMKQQDKTEPSAKDWEEAVVCACMKVEGCFVANDPKQTLLNLEQYWFDTGMSEQSTVEETALILDLRQQLAAKDGEIASLKTVAFQAQNAAIDLAQKLKAVEDIAKERSCD